ncbi:hypothetical protein PIB30_046914 [Stylosanthes scabra]|uniref:Uncharacterized protein n=1 Tax=Stylosanthes scabra TaxID=79078 RepID=A0ABU6WGH9_9FABA|nr:hypothetical protein [Stylosanthes scabra]
MPTILTMELSPISRRNRQTPRHFGPLAKPSSLAQEIDDRDATGANDEDVYGAELAGAEHDGIVVHLQRDFKWWLFQRLLKNTDNIALLVRPFGPLRPQTIIFPKTKLPFHLLGFSPSSHRPHH